MACCEGSSHSYSYHSAKFVGLEPCESEDRIFLICHVTILSHHPSKFEVHRSCESDLRKRNFSRDYDIEVSRDFVGGVLSS